MSRQRPPRQLSVTSVVSTPSLSNAATASSLPSATTALQASGLTSAIASTSAVPSVTPTSVASTQVTPTTSSTPTPSTGTTSTPQTTSTPNTTSQTPTSSPPSTSPQTTSSIASPSSLVPSPGTTPPPTPSSSSQQGVPTTITSSFTTFVNGSAVLSQTAIPTTISQASNHSASTRTAIIAGCAAGGTALLILLLSLAFYSRRKRFKRLDFLHAISLKRKQERSRAMLFDGEDLDELDLARPPLGYADYDTPWDTRHSRESSQHALMGDTRGSRLSETGSAFREDVWPPPGATEGTRLMDPLARDDLNVDLGRIVDDVMGPSSSAVHFSDRSVSSVHRGSVVESEGYVHSRTTSNASNAALLDAAGLGEPVGSPLPNAPVRSSPLAQPGTKPGPGSAEQQGGEGS